MPPPPQSPVKILAVVVALVALAGCQPAPTSRPVPSVAQIGSELKCSSGDTGLTDDQAGWGFCHPGTWKYLERSQTSLNPRGLDLTFDITYVPNPPVACPQSSPSPLASPPPSPSPCSGDFAFMIISTFERGNASNLSGWQQSNLTSPPPAGESISWGNALEATKFADGRRIALTPHHVVVLDLHSGQGRLNLEVEMSSRLNTWKFTY
jgi:hypothetical protein